MCKWTRCFWCFNGHRGFECFSEVDLGCFSGTWWLTVLSEPCCLGVFSNENPVFWGFVTRCGLNSQLS